MAHIRQQIREAVGSRLNNLTTTGTNVYQSEDTPSNNPKPNSNNPKHDSNNPKHNSNIQKHTSNNPKHKSNNPNQF